jgi:hypothetical protein
MALSSPAQAEYIDDVHPGTIKQSQVVLKERKIGYHQLANKLIQQEDPIEKTISRKSKTKPPGP